MKEKEAYRKIKDITAKFSAPPMFGDGYYVSIPGSYNINMVRSGNGNSGFLTFVKEDATPKIRHVPSVTPKPKNKPFNRNTMPQQTDNFSDLYLLLSPGHDSLHILRCNDGREGFRNFIDKNIDRAMQTPMVADN